VEVVKKKSKMEEKSGEGEGGGEKRKGRRWRRIRR
jgi:hypothetical protein